MTSIVLVKARRNTVFIVIERYYGKGWTKKHDICMKTLSTCGIRPEQNAEWSMYKIKNVVHSNVLEELECIYSEMRHFSLSHSPPIRLEAGT